MANQTSIWWLCLCAASLLNVLAWAGSAALQTRRRAMLPGDAAAHIRLQVLLSAGYVFGCAYRSVFPVYDVQRLCLVDSPLSSVLVGRSVATVAELCFAAQWATLLGAVSKRTGSAVGGAVSRLLLPLIAAAETCSWYSVLTTSNLGHVFEESIWGASAALVAAALIIAVGPHAARRSRHLAAFCAVAATAYVVYMFAVDVPMYWARWVADEAHGRQYLGLAEGLLDVSTRRVVTAAWTAWKSEVVWMSLYFSVAVWLSIGLIHVHLPQPRRETHGLSRRGRQALSP